MIILFDLVLVLTRSEDYNTAAFGVQAKAAGRRLATSKTEICLLMWLFIIRQYNNDQTLVSSQSLNYILSCIIAIPKGEAISDYAQSECRTFKTNFLSVCLRMSVRNARYTLHVILSAM